MEAGEMVSANIRLVRLLATGAMGSVWIADHLSLNTQVAVKFMQVDAARNPILAARFTREATAAAQIKSPHVVQILDHGLAPGGEPFIVMELLEGEDLAAHIKRLGPMSPEWTAILVHQLCKALMKAHQAGIIHRDIKPHNIFLIDADKDLFVKLLDFGIAKQKTTPTPDLTSTQEVVGTPLYMSPEQFLSLKHVNSRSDLWSVGAVAYFTLTGSEPFRGDTLGAIYVAIERGVFAPVSSVRSSLPMALDAWFLRSLSRQPEDRFGTAEEMADNFARIVHGASGERATLTPQETIGTRSSFDPSSPTLTEAATASDVRPQGRAPRVATIVSFVLSLAIAIVGVVWWSRSPSTEAVQLAVPAAVPIGTFPPNSLIEPTISPSPVASSTEDSSASLVRSPASGISITPTRVVVIPTAQTQFSGRAKINTGPPPNFIPPPERKTPDRGF